MLVNITVDKDFIVTSDPEPVRVPVDDEVIVFKLDTDGKKYKPTDLKFAGFISPQDLLHKEFEVRDIERDSEGRSTMTVEDKHGRAETFRYELLFAKNMDPYDLYNYDPQIINLP